MNPDHALPAVLAAAVLPFRAGPAFCATLVAANGAPRRPGPSTRPSTSPRPIVTRAEIAALFALDLYAAS